VRLLRDPGLEIGGERIRLDAHTGVTPDVVAAADVVLLAVRSSATTTALDAIAPSLRSTADVVSLQNGLNEDVIAERVGADRTMGCVVGIGSTWLEPGRVSLDAPGELTIGRLDSSPDHRLERARELLSKAFPTKTTDNIRGALWGKMLVNSMTVLGALSGILTGELLATPDRRRLVADIVGEGIAVADAEGVELPPVFGAVPAHLVHSPLRWYAEMDRVLARFGETRGAIKSVTLRDFEIGRPTEIDAVTGEIVRRGERNGVPTPLSASVYAMLRGIEAGTRSPAMANLETLRVPT
jgi:2-dehydropantoate 2-reductase